MKYLVLKTTDPYINLATEEYLFNKADDDIFMLWQNHNTVVIGKNQNAYAEVDTEYLKKNGIRIARRITGGGAVYHDAGNVNYTFISSKSKSGTLDFEYFTAPIIDALAALGVRAELSGRNDLLVNGKKFSGNAQHSSNGKVLHHGTLLFDSDLSVLSNALVVDPEKIASKAIKSTKSRVINLKNEIGKDIDSSTFIDLILDYVVKKYAAEEICPPSFDEIKELYDKYSSDEWIYSDKKYLVEYTVKRKKRYPFGIVNVDLTLEKNRVNSARISGDFFGEKDTAELETYLVGSILTETALSGHLLDVDIGNYIFGMNKEEFMSLLLEV